jgi:hypothetical protein
LTDIENQYALITKALANLVKQGPEIKNMPEYMEVVTCLDAMKNNIHGSNLEMRKSVIYNKILILLKVLNYLKRHSVMYLFNIDQELIDSFSAFVAMQQKTAGKQKIPEDIKRQALRLPEILGPGN